MSSRLPISTRNSFAARARTAAAAVMLASFAIACSSHEQKATADSAGTTAASGDVSAQTATAPVKGTIHLEVSGGPMAGKYDVKMTDGGCSYGLTGADSWGNQYSINGKDPKAFTSLQLIVPDAKAAAHGTSVFQMTVAFGPLFGKGQTSYDINTRPEASTKSGSGTVTVDDKGNTGRVTFDAKSADGIGFKGTIDCASVMRAS